MISVVASTGTACTSVVTVTSVVTGSDSGKGKGGWTFGSACSDIYALYVGECTPGALILNPLDVPITRCAIGT